MSVPFVALGLPPLPPGWSEHLAPGGQSYYYNAATHESTYVRPVPTFPLPAAQSQAEKNKKEKPLAKTAVPGTDWLRVRTTEGNVFYSHKVTKDSKWTVPDEIKDAVAALELEEKEKEENERVEAEARILRVAKERELELARIKLEVEEAVKRKAEDEAPLDEIVITKKPRIDDQQEDNDSEDDDEESEEEEWQREAAAQLAAEAEEAKTRQEEEAQRAKEESAAAAQREQEAQLKMPDRVDLSLDEAKALFKTLLREKNVNPLHPWDTSLPLFVSDPRYVLLPSVAIRREAFDEYCRERARELRQSKVKQDKSAANPKEDYEALLKEEVQSTRTSWSDFRKAWKKDRRFWGWGRDDREREKRFREFLKGLGEKKRAAAQKAEAGFFALLREKGNIKPDAVWKEVKRKLVDDPRYDAVGSSTLREELFHTFLKAAPSSSHDEKEKCATTVVLSNEDDDVDRERSRKERRERAVKEREDKVIAERNRLQADIGRSKQGLDQEEGELDFKTMLIDAIRDPKATWDEALLQLRTDPRFRNSPLPPNRQLHLFHAHVGQLRSKQMDNLYALFESHTPNLATRFHALPLDSLMTSSPVTRLGISTDVLEHEFEKWQRERTTAARKAFDEMLTENSFIEFWGRLGKIGGEGVEGGVQADDLGDDEGEGGGGKVDMKVLAKNVDVTEMEKVLKNDKRYIMFNHVPEQRERWIRDYLARLSAPKLSVHQPTPA